MIFLQFIYIETQIHFKAMNETSVESETSFAKGAKIALAKSH
jgi:hypothetical protein